MRRLNAFLASALLLVPVLAAAEKYSGPRPPKPDVPYILHADNLLETEAATATNETRKDATYAVINGAASTAKTPLAEPAFIIRTEKLVADKIRAYKLEPTKNGKREVLINHKKPKNVPRPIFVAVTKLDDKLYKIEIDEPLENGEYALSPDDSDLTFNFAIY